MSNPDRLTTQLEPGCGALLIELAGGKRGRGRYLSGLIRSAAQGDIMLDFARRLESLEKRLDDCLGGKL